MYQTRVNKLLEKASEHNAGGFLLINHEGSGQPDAQYLSGFTGSECMLLITPKEKLILVDGRYFSAVTRDVPEYEMVKTERTGFFEKVNELVGKLGIKSLLLDSAQTAYNAALSLNGAKLVGEEYLMQDLRVVKNEEELELMKKAADVACNAFNRLFPEIKEGVTEKWVAARLEFLIKEEGGDKYSFDTIVASGLNGAFPHAKPSDKEIQKGELVTIDWGAYYQGYASDMTRTVAVGEISDKLSEIYQVVKESQQSGCDAAKAGLTGIELDKVCRDHIDARNYGEFFVHGTGHGLGMDVHEKPYVNNVNDQPMPENSVVTVEPGIYIEGTGGVRIEDCLVLKQDGSVNLNTGVSKELLTL